MSVINGIDYDHLAAVSESSGVQFHTLCQRAEKGLPIRDLVGEDDEWVNYKSTAKILDSAYGSLASTLTSAHCELDYYGIRWKSRSRVKKSGKRGCGVLFKRADLIVIRNIKTHAHLSLTSALKVFQAMQLGRI